LSDSSPPLVVTVGSTHIDLVARAPRLPVRGETLPGSGFAIHPGGKGGNQAVAVARAGGRSVFLGRVGRDEFGDRLRHALEAAGVDLSRLGIDADTATGCSTVLTGDDGDYASVIVPGASLMLSAALVEAALSCIGTPRAIVGQLEIRPEATMAAFAAGREAGASTILNAAPAPERLDEQVRELSSLADILVVNRVEAAMLAGHATHELVDPEATARELRDQFGASTIVVTLGEAGSLAVSANTTIQIDAYPVVPVDTIGAGDAFVGALAVALASGLSLETALTRANAAGAIAVTRAGGHDAAPTVAEVDAFLTARRTEQQPS
jgi:ribokinase